jgi:hypothetical protein
VHFGPDLTAPNRVFCPFGRRGTGLDAQKPVNSGQSKDVFAHRFCVSLPLDRRAWTGCWMPRIQPRSKTGSSSSLRLREAMNRGLSGRKIDRLSSPKSTVRDPPKLTVRAAQIDGSRAPKSAVRDRPNRRLETAQSTVLSRPGSTLRDRRNRRFELAIRGKCMGAGLGQLNCGSV